MQKIPIITKCLIAAGSWPAGVFLYRMSYWQRHTQITHGAHTWVVMSREEWMREINCSLKEYTNIIKQLKDGGLIEVEHHLFSNRKRAYIRLTDRALRVIRDGPPEGSMDSAPTGTTYIEKEGIKESIKENGNAAPEAPENIEGHEEPMKVEDVIAKHKHLTKVHKPNVTGLSGVWKETLAEVYSPGFIHMTKVEIGQLKHIMNSCPAGKAHDVVEWVIRHWNEFAAEVESDAGLKKTPAAPRIDFLLKYIAVAVKLYLEPKNKAAAPKEGPKPLPIPQTVQVIAQDADDETPLSKDELKAMLKGKGP